MPCASLLVPPADRHVHRPAADHGRHRVAAAGARQGAVLAGHAATLAIALLFFLYGARLAPQAALAGARNGKLHLMVFLSTFVLFPLLGLAARALFPHLLTPALWAGVILLCALPSTVQSSVAFTSIARGNVPAALCSATVSNLLGIVLTPLLAGLLLVRGRPRRHLRPHGRRHPAAAAAALRRRAGAAAVDRRLGGAQPPGAGLVDRGSILLVVYAAFSEGMVAGIWHSLDVAMLAAAVRGQRRAAGRGAGDHHAAQPAAGLQPGRSRSPSCSAAPRRAWRAACRWRACCSPAARSG